jgi:hypothetical protein
MACALAKMYRKEKAFIDERWPNFFAILIRHIREACNYGFAVVNVETGPVAFVVGLSEAGETSIDPIIERATLFDEAERRGLCIGETDNANGFEAT